MPLELIIIQLAKGKEINQNQTKTYGARIRWMNLTFSIVHKSFPGNINMNNLKLLIIGLAENCSYI